MAIRNSLKAKLIHKFDRAGMEMNEKNKFGYF